MKNIKNTNFAGKLRLVASQLAPKQSFCRQLKILTNQRQNLDFKIEKKLLFLYVNDKHFFLILGKKSCVGISVKLDRN